MEPSALSSLLESTDLIVDGSERTSLLERLNPVWPEIQITLPADIKLKVLYTFSRVCGRRFVLRSCCSHLPLI